MAKTSALKRWTLIWSGLDVALLLAGVFVMVISFMWKGLLMQPPQENKDIFLRLAVSDSILTAGIVFSISTFFAVLVSLWPLTSKPTKDDAKTTPVVWYLGILGFITLVTISIGTAIWFYTLRERAAFTPIWSAQTPQIQIFLQDQLKCCGWFNATSAGLFTPELQTGFCANPSTLPVSPDPNVSIGCVSPFVSKVDFILNNIFTTIYGFVTVEVALLMAGATVAQLRLQERRFLRIDFKAGKGGFV